MVNWFDICLLAMVFLSVIVGFSRGFFQEAMTVSAWALAFVMAYLYAVPWSVHLQTYIDSPSLRIIILALAMLIVTLVLAKIISRIVAVLLKFSGLKGFDHILGIIFGGLRGWLVVMLIVLALVSLQLNKDQWFTQSKVVPWVNKSTQLVKKRIPADVKKWWYGDKAEPKPVTK